MQLVLLICLGLLHVWRVGSIPCLNVATYEGAVTLQNGASACAPLLPDEPDSHRGRQFVTCNNGVIFTQNCSSNLRYDTDSKTCNWPQLSSCSLVEATTPPPTPAVIDPGTVPPSNPPFPQAACSDSNCPLPNCFCYGADYTVMKKEDTPQFIMITFDDGVTALLYEQYYRPLFVGSNRKTLNPDGCGMKTTMYMINENTDYTKVKELAAAGNEIASHTIHHLLPLGDNPRDYTNMSAEINGIKELVLTNTGDAKLANSVRGFRAPYLRVAGDVMFQVLRDSKFVYDTSIDNIETSQGRPPLWPYTLDFPVKSCVNPPCPKRAFPGLWEVPLNSWVGDDGNPCPMIDGCMVGTDLVGASEQEWYNYYKRNFDEHFYKNKVPMHMFTHAALFIRSINSFPALIRWLDDTLKAHRDVWVVTPQQVISWMQNPQTNAEMIANKWSCKPVSELFTS